MIVKGSGDEVLATALNDVLRQQVLTAQLHRFSPPYPGQAHRTWYIGAGGTVEDTAGSLAPSHGKHEDG